MLQVGRALARAANGRGELPRLLVALGNTVAVHVTLLLHIAVGRVLLVGRGRRISRRLVGLTWISRRIDARMDVVRAVWQRRRYVVDIAAHVRAMSSGRLHVLATGHARTAWAHATIVHQGSELTIVVDRLWRPVVVQSRREGRLRVDRCRITIAR